MEHENFDDVRRINWPDEERTTNLDEPDGESEQEAPSVAQRQAQRQSGNVPDTSAAPPPNMPDPRLDDNAGRPPTPPDA